MKTDKRRTEAVADHRQTAAETLALVLTAAITLGLSATPAGAYEAMEVDDTGTISGWVQVEAEDTSERFEPDQDTDLCGEEIEISTIEVDGDGRLEHAVVFITEIASGRRIDKTIKHPLRIERCRVTPRLLAITAGQVVEIINQDPVLHTIRATRPAQEQKVEFTTSLPVKGMRISKRPPHAGLLELRCTAGHGEMRTWIYVFEHPYHAMTDDDGRFTIEGVPPGDYQLTAWHPVLGSQTLDVGVTAGSKAEAEFTQLATESD